MILALLACQQIHFVQNMSPSSHIKLPILSERTPNGLLNIIYTFDCTPVNRSTFICGVISHPLIIWTQWDGWLCFTLLLLLPRPDIRGPLSAILILLFEPHTHCKKNMNIPGFTFTSALMQTFCIDSVLSWDLWTAQRSLVLIHHGGHYFLPACLLQGFLYFMAPWITLLKLLKVIK